MTRWTEIEGFPNYLVSDDGRVRSLDMQRRIRNGGLQFVPGRERIPQEKANGYFYIQLRQNGERKNQHIHRLVAAAFVPNPYGKSEVNHRDGDKSNNHYSNLEWVTKSENSRHAIDVLGKCRGETHFNSKLTDQQVAEIRGDNRSQRQIAAAYGICQQSVSRIRTHNGWRHI